MYVYFGGSKIRLHRENRENANNKNPCLRGTQEILPKHRESIRNFVCSSRKYPDFKDQGYCPI